MARVSWESSASAVANRPVSSSCAWGALGSSLSKPVAALGAASALAGIIDSNGTPLGSEFVVRSVCSGSYRMHLAIE